MSQTEDLDKGKGKDNPKDGEKGKVVTFYVDGEPVSTEKQEITVREVLELSGNEPVEQYELEELHGKSDNEKTYKNLDEMIKVHPNQRFSATFKGETPYS